MKIIIIIMMIIKKIENKKITIITIIILIIIIIIIIIIKIIIIIITSSYIYLCTRIIDRLISSSNTNGPRLAIWGRIDFEKGLCNVKGTLV